MMMMMIIIIMIIIIIVNEISKKLIDKKGKNNGAKKIRHKGQGKREMSTKYTMIDLFQPWQTSRKIANKSNSLTTPPIPPPPPHPTPHPHRPPPPPTPSPHPQETKQPKVSSHLAGANGVVAGSSLAALVRMGYPHLTNKVSQVGDREGPALEGKERKRLHQLLASEAPTSDPSELPGKPGICNH